MPYTLHDPVTGFSGIYPNDLKLTLAMCDHVKEHAPAVQAELMKRYTETDWRQDDDIEHMFLMAMSDDPKYTALQIAARIVTNRLEHG